ncbi:hypothetical protein BaRGS_00034919 [Batillaria attramentaria]|uniref:Uncharacterized protein n=1 Tax=Batillaria attramentaria TaxID=370345 RepID=A0ABD0JFW6_9CAEN
MRWTLLPAARSQSHHVKETPAMPVSHKHWVEQCSSGLFCLGNAAAPYFHDLLAIAPTPMTLAAGMINHYLAHTNHHQVCHITCIMHAGLRWSDGHCYHGIIRLCKRPYSNTFTLAARITHYSQFSPRQKHISSA